MTDLVYIFCYIENNGIEWELEDTITNGTLMSCVYLKYAEVWVDISLAFDRCNVSIKIKI